MRPRSRLFVIATACALAAPTLEAQEVEEPATLEGLRAELRTLRERQDDQRHAFDRLAKAIDDVMWRVALDTSPRSTRSCSPGLPATISRTPPPRARETLSSFGPTRSCRARGRRARRSR